MRPLPRKALILIATFLVIGISTFFLMPDATKLNGCFTTKMFKVEVCPKNARYTKLSSISPHLRNAVIVSEDGSFYSHKGFDWFEMKASFRTNLKTGSFKRGGSTITQQLAKNAFLSSDKSFFRKGLEAYLTFQIESLYSKDFILEKYLNMVEFGPNVYGARAAAAHYFKKSPAQLHPLEAVYLAHLLPNPKVYSRGFSKGALTPYSKKMVQALLKRLLQYGKLSGPQYQFAMSQVPYFPWSHLSNSSFENLRELEDKQQDAIEQLMEEDFEDEPLPPDPPPEVENF